MSAGAYALTLYIQEQNAMKHELLHAIEGYKERRKSEIKSIIKKRGIIRENLLTLLIVTIQFSALTPEITSEEREERQQQKINFLASINKENKLIIQYTQNLFTLGNNIIEAQAELGAIEEEIAGLEKLDLGSMFNFIRLPESEQPLETEQLSTIIENIFEKLFMTRAAKTEKPPTIPVTMSVFLRPKRQLSTADRAENEQRMRAYITQIVNDLDLAVSDEDLDFATSDEEAGSVTSDEEAEFVISDEEAILMSAYRHWDKEKTSVDLAAIGGEIIQSECEELIVPVTKSVLILAVAAQQRKQEPKPMAAQDLEELTDDILGLEPPKPIEKSSEFKTFLAGLCSTFPLFSSLTPRTSAQNRPSQQIGMTRR